MITPTGAETSSQARHALKILLKYSPAIMLARAFEIWYSISRYLGRKAANPMTTNISQQMHRQVTT